MPPKKETKKGKDDGAEQVVQAPVFPVRVDPVFEELKCIFTREEKEELSQKMAQTIEDIGKIELEKKQAQKKFDSQIAAANREIHDLARKVKDGYELRDVEGTITYNYENKMKVYKRLDTGEEYKKIPMSINEQQMPLPSDQVEPPDTYAGENLPPAEVPGVEEQK